MILCQYNFSITQIRRRIRTSCIDIDDITTIISLPQSVTTTFKL